MSTNKQQHHTDARAMSKRDAQAIDPLLCDCLAAAAAAVAPHACLVRATAASSTSASVPGGRPGGGTTAGKRTGLGRAQARQFLCA